MKALLVLVVCASACGDDELHDLGAPQDLTAADVPVELPDVSACTPPVFGGFTVSDAEQTLDCTRCGCLVDSLDDAATSPLWTRVVEGSTLTGGSNGLRITGPGNADALLRSTFFLDGDFELRVDVVVQSGQAELGVFANVAYDPVTTSTSATIALSRHGATLVASDGSTIAGTSGRVAIDLSARSSACDAGSCAVDVTLANLRLASGTLVDRSP